MKAPISIRTRSDKGQVRSALVNRKWSTYAVLRDRPYQYLEATTYEEAARNHLKLCEFLL